ncbi:MAG: PAS domain S-box-containing protein [Flavobacteriales bacterium]|jgi:PAS domain S-box-containing protein
MIQTNLSAQFLDQSKDLFWMVNEEFQLIYANPTFLSFMTEAYGEEKKLNESVFMESFDEDYIIKWKNYYCRALKGESFEIEEHFYYPVSNIIRYSRVTFEPLIGENQRIFTVACQSKDISGSIKQLSEANQLIDSFLGVFCTVNEQGYFMYVSIGATNHWGYSPEELIGKSYQDFIVLEDLPKTSAMTSAILTGQDIISFENRYRKKDGGIAYNFWSARWDDNNKLIYCVARDGKEMVEQEDRILKSEQRYKALVQEGYDLIGILDAEGNYTYVSPTSTAILGITPEEFIGRNALEFVHQDDVENTLASLQKITTDKRVVVTPFRFLNHKKELRWVETVLTNMLDNPAVNGIVANSRDITAKIEKDHQLKLFESVITNTKDAILITDAEPSEGIGHKIIYVNEAFTKMTGYDAEEVIGKSPKMLQGPNSNKEELVKLGRALKNWESHEMTTLNYKKNGEEFWVNFALTPVADEKGSYTHWIAVERDITEQKIKELENSLLAQISVDFKIENDYSIAVNELCKSISKIGNFDWVELWTSNLEKNQMLLFSHYVAEIEDKRFYDYSPEFVADQKSEGLSNNLWSGGVQLLWSDDKQSDGFIRRDAAKKIGLKSVIGIPLIYNDEAIGVLKIGTKKSANYLNNYIRIFQRLEVFIASELNRKKLENDLSHLFNAIPDIICVLDFQGRFLKINKSGCDLIGFSEENILYHNFDEFVHPDNKEIFNDQVTDLEKEKSTFKFENRYVTNNGDTLWLSWYCNSTLKEGLIYATAKNITEEKKLRELNREVRSLVKIGSWEVDLVNKSVFWSDEVHQLHDTNPKSFIPDLESAINFYRADFRQLIRDNITACISTGEQYDFEAVLVTTKNKEIWVRAIGNTEFINGKCKRIYGSFQDINDRKEAEVRLQSLADNLPGVVFQYLIYPDGTDNLKYVTKGAKEVWGFSTEQVLQNLQVVWDGIEAGGEIENLKKRIADSVRARTKLTAQWKYIMPNGEIRTHFGCASPSYLADGTVLFNAVILDVTKEAANEALLEQYTYELERSNEELEQFAFVASHDLQEPLRMITSFMDLLQRKYGDQIDEKGHQYIHFATDGAKRMKQIILDLLDYSRASKSIEGKEEVDLNEILSEFKQLRRKIISEKSASINSNKLPILYTYKVAIMQTLHCLLDNALKYTEVGTIPKIEINAIENEKEWEFSIQDNGIGIDSQFYDKIFVIFQRLHNNDKYSGTGIGLSITKKHVEFLGGRIWLESTPKKGTIFYFIIPKIK